jgi:hypothetical protein
VTKRIVLPWGGPAVRSYRFRQAFEALGWDVPMFEGTEYGEGTANFLAEHGLEHDIVWTNAWSEAASAFREILKDRGAKVLAEVDDLFSEVPTGNIVHKYWQGDNRERYKKLLREADARICSTPFLGERFNAKVAPNFIVPEKWDFPLRHREDEDSCILLCPAGNGRAGDYFEIEEPLKRFLNEPNTKVVFVGFLPQWAYEYRPGKVVMCRWVDHDIYPKLMRYINPDIVVSPLIKDNFNAAKSNIKWLESAMLEACFVGTDWGELRRTVNHGETGFLCQWSDDWGDILVELARNKTLRDATSKCAHDVVLSEWTWEGVRDDWLTALEI